jgi:hypothetical protein
MKVAAEWTNPVHIGASHRRVLNLGQLIRSIVLAAVVLAAAVTIALEPAHHSASEGAPNERTASDRSRPAESFVVPDARIALDQPSAALSADRAVKHEGAGL